jgi:cytochrome oxidase Cu insertion factor (SCO1/SenC/PrrC family)
MWFGVAFCLAVWVLFQDLGFLGGVGTDPNSMIPIIVLLVAGYLAIKPAPQQVAASEQVPAEAGAAAADAGPATAGTGPGGWRQRLRPRALGSALATASARSVVAFAAVAVIVLGAAPMASATADHSADPLLALAISGDSETLNQPAAAFRLTDQNGQTVTQVSLRGKVVLLTFLDPVCTTDCPIIAQELEQTGTLLGAKDKDVELVAIVANPTYRSTVFTQAFDRQEGLTGLRNWLFLTGSLPQLAALWRQYGVTVEDLPAGAMSAHDDLVLVINRAGVVLQDVNADPGPGTTSTQSSYSVLLSQYARQALAGS